MNAFKGPSRSPAGTKKGDAFSPKGPPHHPPAYWAAGGWNRSHHNPYPWYRGSWGRYGLGYPGYWGAGLYAYGWPYWGLFGGPFGYGGLYGYGFGSPYCLLGTGLYGSYYNPYFQVSPGATYDYGQPFVVPDAYASPAPVEPPPVNEIDRQLALQWLESARIGFKEMNYPLALDHATRAVARLPNDPVLHEFRALAQFALEDYRGAAATLHPVVAAGPGWDWDTVKSLYATTAEYTRQLRMLEAFQRQHSDRAEPSFVLAYHYLVLNAVPEALSQLENVVAHTPGDQVSRTLLAKLREGPVSDRPYPQPR